MIKVRDTGKTEAGKDQKNERIKGQWNSAL